MKVFFDANVLFDVLSQREPFYSDSAGVWTLAESGQIRGFVSVLTLPTLFYLLRRGNPPEVARQALAALRQIFTIVSADSLMVDQAVASDIDDFEDAMQWFSAVRAGAAVLVTRNCKHFPKNARLRVQTPTDFLAEHFPD